MRISLVIRNISFVLLVNAAFMFLSAFISVVYGINSDFYPLLLSAFITSATGIFPLLFIPRNPNLSTREVHFFVVFSWLISCIFGMLPYILWGGEFSLADAWFESVSGYTTTGASILTDVESIPKGLLFWRASTHYIGGVGVVMFALLVLQSVRTTRMKLTNAEMSQLAHDNFKFKTYQMLRVILSVYLGLTTILVALLMLFGMDFFDAVCHAFSTVATGGFSTKNQSVLSFNSTPIDIVITIFMFISGIHFGLIYAAVAGRSKAIFRSQVVRFYFFSIVIGIILIALNLLAKGTYTNVFKALYHSAFQTVAAATTTGFATADTSTWPIFSVCIIIYFYFQCACAGSTSGGIKVDRIIIMYKAVYAELISRLHPNAVIPIRVGKTIVDKDVVISSMTYIALYMIILLIATTFMSLCGIDMFSGFTTALAFLSNVGPSLGKYGSSMSNFDGLPAIIKLCSPILMILGRLEIYGLFLVFIRSKYNR